MTFKGIKPDHPDVRTPQEIKAVEEARQKQREVFANHEREIWRLDHWQMRPQNREQWLLIAEELISDGHFTLEDFTQVLTKIEREKKERETKKAKSELESQRKAEKLQRFPTKFMRLCGYLSIKSYNAELEESAKTATLTELEETQKMLMENKKPTLTDTQRSLALNWLNATIQRRQSQEIKRVETSASLARGLHGLFRKH